MSTLVASNLQASGGTGTAALLASINGGSISGARNRIINGDMKIDQRNNGASVVVAGLTGDYTLDRWMGFEFTDGAATIQRSTTVPAGHTNSLLYTVTTADTSLAAGQFGLLQQKIEGNNVSDLEWGTASAVGVTLSFWVRSSVTGTFGGSLRNDANDRSYVFSYTINAASTWEYKTVTIPGDTTGTWLKDTGTGIRLIFCLGSGSTGLATAGSWSAGTFIGPTAQTNLFNTNGSTFHITGVQLEAGSVATPFERRSYGQELALCQRYYEAQSSTELIMWPPIDSAGNNGARRLWAPFVVTKRAAPTITLTASQGLTSVSTASYVNGFRHAGTQGAFLETAVTSWTASIEL